MSTPFTYSFLDTQASINGPGAAFAIGAGAGAAEEGITIEPNDDADTLTIGADGTPMHSLKSNKGAKVTVRLLKTSPVNQQLSLALAFQRASGANWGQNSITLMNTVSGDMHTLQQVAFARSPSITYAKEGGMNEWTFNAGIWDFALGGGAT